MRCLWTCGLLVVVGCVDGADDLGPGNAPAGPTDAGVPNPGRDAGFDPDVGVAPADAGMLRPDAAPAPDAGTSPECPTGWTTIATTSEAQGLQTESFAALQLGYAVTWNVFDEDWTQTTYLQFFDAAVVPRGPPRLVPPGSRVVAVDGRFLLGGQPGIAWFEPDGTPGATTNLGPFLPSAVIGGRVFGRVLRDASPNAPAVLTDGFTAARDLPVELSFESKVVFGDGRMAIVDGAQTGATVRLFSLVDDVPSLLAEHQTVPIESDGVRWLPTQLSAGAWNSDLARFELLFAVNMSNGRFYGPEIFSLDDTALTAGPLLLDPRVEVSHGSLEGAVALSEGRLAVAYNDTYPQSDVELNVIVDGASQIHSLGATIRSQPILAPKPGGLAVLSAYHAPGPPFWENELQILCDLF